MGIANLAIENQIRYFGQQTEIPYVILRSVSIFWHSDSETVTKLASAGSDGIHVGDVARGLILAAQQSAANNQIINLGSGRAISKLDTMKTSVSVQS